MQHRYESNKKAAKWAYLEWIFYYFLVLLFSGLLIPLRHLNKDYEYTSIIISLGLLLCWATLFHLFTKKTKSIIIDEANRLVIIECFNFFKSQIFEIYSFDKLHYKYLNKPSMFSNKKLSLIFYHEDKKEIEIVGDDIDKTMLELIDSKLIELKIQKIE